MATTTHSPELHSVFNELDRFGLLLGLSRLEGERNAEYKQRLLDVLVNRAGSTYRGLINGITRELGLRIQEIFTVSPIRDTDGVPVAPSPAIVFQETKCKIYSDYTLGDDGLVTTLDRFEFGDGYTIQDVIDTINETGLFLTDIILTDRVFDRAMTIFNQSTITTVTSEELDTAGARIKLKNRGLLSNSLVVRSSNLRERVDTQEELRRAGQYYVDMEEGIMYCTSSPSPGSVVRYQYRNDNYRVLASPVIIHNIQSTDFRSKMFDQLTLNGETTDGAPSALGAELINELLSVFPVGWGS
jgi:hypothetical protein